MFLTLPELVDPSLLSTLNRKFELQFPRLDLQNDYKSEVHKSRIFLFSRFLNNNISISGL